MEIELRKKLNDPYPGYRYRVFVDSKEWKTRSIRSILLDAYKCGCEGKYSSCITCQIELLHRQLKDKPGGTALIII